MLLTRFQVASVHTQEADEQLLRHTALSQIYLLLKSIIHKLINQLYIHTNIHTLKLFCSLIYT